MVKGHGIGPLDGDGFQLAGMFLLSEKELSKQFRAIRASDRPPIQEWLEWNNLSTRATFASASMFRNESFLIFPLKGVSEELRLTKQYGYGKLKPSKA